ncbi:terpene synthase family protein [Streptomyces capillispiralis]|uniref:Terpene synthase n=1 Tax=Streptomyces capillispiralis TaxID=68182 RepID=A0A561SGK3_9ACTN|nr:hypothetical protein [Streptomyces capillispiralis]TWF73989.1 hypothetical protein FHX78_1221 [Streptomyces capillispiralis]GHH96322.1 hypothetical protein GCM10017779_67790 [Streptomyces capillispiralis]
MPQHLSRRLPETDGLTDHLYAGQWRNADGDRGGMPDESVHLWCPYEHRMNTHVSLSAVEAALRSWADAYGLLRDPSLAARFDAARFGECAAFVYPDAPDLIIYAKWLAWLFVADDEFDENRAPEAGGIDRGILQFLPLDGKDCAKATTGVTKALADLWPELCQPMPLPLRVRFRAHADDYARSYATDLSRARTGSAPPLDAYLALRRSSGAVESCLDLIERQPDAYLTPVIAESPRILALREAANDVICWTNDVISLNKEMRHGEMNNLVAVIRQSVGMSWEAALEVAAEMNSARIRDFDRQQQTLLHFNDLPGLSEFIHGVQVWISGSLHWHRDSPRYADQVL